MDALKYILVQFVVAMLCVGGVVGLVTGIGLLLRPDRIAHLNQYFSRWFSADKMTEQLDRPRYAEKFFYRHHRLTGSALLIGALFILYIFLFTYNVRRISAAIPSGYWLLTDVLVAFLVAGCIVAILVGLIVAIRPSMLREIEIWANRWVATDGIVRFFNRMSFSPDQKVLGSRKVSGVLIVAGSLYILVRLVPLLLSGGWRF